MKLVFRPIMWLVSDEINGKTHMVVTNPAGTIVCSPQATEPPLPSLVPPPTLAPELFPSLVSPQRLRPCPRSPLMSALTQQRDAGQSEWWAELFALQLGFSVCICQPVAILPGSRWAFISSLQSLSVKPNDGSKKQGR